MPRSSKSTVKATTGGLAALFVVRHHVADYCTKLSLVDITVVFSLSRHSCSTDSKQRVPGRAGGIVSPDK